MPDYKAISKDLYERFHDAFEKLYVSELKDQIAEKDEIITANDHVIAEQQAEIERLKEKCDKQAMVIRRIYVDQFPDTWFAWHGYGEKDRNNLPQYIEVIPAHGVGWSQVYERTDRTISMEGS